MDKQREAFEKIVLILLGNDPPWLEKYTTDEFNGQYVNGSVQEAWQAWQAAIASQQAEIESLKAQLAESEWVSVKDRLPDEYQQVLIFTNKKTFELDRLIKDYGWEATNDIVKYWIAINAPTENT
jgi:hypothetical protein